MRPTPGLLVLLILAHSGCGAADPRAMSRTAATVESEMESRTIGYAALAEPSSDRAMGAAGEMAMGGMMGMMGAASPLELQDAPPPEEAGFNRKIIYDAQIDLEVEDLDPAADRLVSLVQQHRGYIAEQDVAGSPGSKRSAKWKLRVPVEEFEAFVQELLSLGELKRNVRTSQDVSEQFYDIEARIRNKRVEEETILKILEERSGQLEDVLKVQVELSRVRGEIEQMEGRLRVLENLSSLATVTVNLRERDDYAPAAPVVPDFRTRVARAWSGSVTDLRTSAENFVVFVSERALPTLVVLLALIAVFPLVRRLWRRLLRALPRLWEQLRRPIGSSPEVPPSPPEPSR
ncbi:DUF4349 domain-containing protein [Tautonia sp. JC769]|uniref:DUF4349 domain-containing protein n=1 Tax=Tautonia sp. JC769 TaxID=3232135 RepID=UPI003459A1FD